MACLLKGGGGLYSRLIVGGVLLAAGAASRMGYRPKGLLELGGVPLIRRQLIALSGAGVDEVVVVLGHYADQLRPLVESFPVTIVSHPQPDVSQNDSLRLGLGALSAKLDAVLVALVDQPLIGAADIQDLMSRYKKRPDGTEVVQPTVHGQPGNPVMFSAAVRDALLAGEARVGCRQWQQAHPERVDRWPTENARYTLDVDSADDIEELAQRTGHRLRWPARSMEFFVGEMHCAKCEEAVLRAVSRVDPQARVDVDLPAQHLRVDTRLEAQAILEALLDEGFVAQPRRART